MESQKSVRVLFLRHGATPGNLEHRYVGRTDEDLTDESADRIRKAAPAFREQYLTGRIAVITSPLLRCTRTADLLVGSDRKVVREDDGKGTVILRRTVADFRETDFGAFEYKNYEELSGNPDYQRFIDSNGETPFPGGESREEVRKRVLPAFREVVSSLSDLPDLTLVLFVLHGGTIMTILSNYAENPKDFYSYQCGNLQGFSGTLCFHPLCIREVMPYGL
jgi:alpha-ribazole phosphatase